MQVLHKKYGLLLILAWLVVPAQTSALSSWLTTQDPILSTVKGSISTDQIPYHASPTCTPNTTFITVPKDILKARPEVSFTACATRSNFGLHEPNGLIKLHDTNVAGPVKSSSGGARMVSPIPNSNHVFFVAGGLYGSNRYIIRDFIHKIETKLQPNGSVIHQLKPGVDGESIKDAAGNLVDFNGGIFSSNGKWMIGDVHQVGMTRVNIETGETLIFGAPYNHANGVKPNFVAAISSDGRYAVATEDDYGLFMLYDLSTCTPSANPIKQATCQSRNLMPAVQRILPHFKEATYISFSTNYTLRIYARNTNNLHSYFTLSAAGESESLLDYVALGDSFASGEGTFNYKPYTDVREPFNGCHLSPLSYPYLLAGRTLLNGVQSVACSGARITNLTNPDHSEYESQAKGKSNISFNDEIFNNYLVGYRPQIAFVEKNKPSKVTVSISGNDIGFSSILLSCLAPGTCYETAQEKLNIAHTINTKYDELVTTYQAIKQQSSTTANIYALGYPLLAASPGNCALNVQLNSHEIEFSNNIIMHLNSVIERAAKKAGVVYIDVTHALNKYRLCDGPSDTLAVNGLTLGDDKTFSVPLTKSYQLEGYFSGRESFHPNQLGHRLLADAITSATNNLKIPSPEPAYDTLNPTTHNISGLTTPQSQSLLPRRISYIDIIEKGIVTHAAPQTISINNLLPGSDLTLFTTPHTFQPISIKASSSGIGSGSVTIPATYTGITTLHATATSISGEPLDYQQVIYGAASRDDIDGDGIPNTGESCLLVEASRVDSDEDTIDDACDHYIGKSSLHVSATAITTPTSLRASTTPSVSVSVIKSASVLPAQIPISILREIPLIGTVRSAVMSTFIKNFNPLTPPDNHTRIADNRHTIVSFIVVAGVIGVIFFAQKRWHNHH